MEDVQPRAWNEGPVRSPGPVEIRSGETEDAALEMLAEFCRNGRVGPEHTREYVEHFAHPTGRLYLDDLRSGRFAIQAHLDLHSAAVRPARAARGWALALRPRLSTGLPVRGVLSRTLSPGVSDATGGT